MLHAFNQIFYPTSLPSVFLLPLPTTPSVLRPYLPPFLGHHAHHAPPPPSRRLPPSPSSLPPPMAPPLLCLLGCLLGRVAPVHEHSSVAGPMTNGRFKIQSKTNFQISKLKAYTRTIQLKKVKQSKRTNKASLGDRERKSPVSTDHGGTKAKGCLFRARCFSGIAISGWVLFRFLHSHLPCLSLFCSLTFNNPYLSVLFSILPQPLSICFLSFSTTRKRPNAPKVIRLHFSHSGRLRHIQLRSVSLSLHFVSCRQHALNTDHDNTHGHLYITHDVQRAKQRV